MSLALDPGSASCDPASGVATSCVPAARGRVLHNRNGDRAGVQRLKAHVASPEDATLLNTGVWVLLAMVRPRESAGFVVHLASLALVALVLVAVGQPISTEDLWWHLALLIPVAVALALAKAGNSSAARMAMMAMTTSNSISVKPPFFIFMTN